MNRHSLAVPRSTARPIEERPRLRRPAMAALIAALVLVGGRVANADSGHSAPGLRDAASVAGSAGPVKAEAPNAGAGGFSARALAWQAQAELAAGHPGRAILHYERARFIAPRAPAVAAGLARARAAAGVSAVGAGVVGRVARRLGADEWGRVAIAGLLLTSVAFVTFAWELVRRRGFLALALAGVGAASIGTLGARLVAPPANLAVVVAPGARALIAPFDRADPAFVAPEGALVTVERTHGDYALVAGPEGQGWVPRAGIETILPAGRGS